MGDDVCADWYEEDEYDAAFPRAQDESGWGIDESMYTSTLDTSSLSPEQIALAERLAREIEKDSVTKKRQGGGFGRAAATRPQLQMAAPQPVQPLQHPPAQSFAQPTLQPPPAPVGYQVTPPHEQYANECKVVAFLQGEMRRVLELIGTLGEPRPDQAAKLLTVYTTSVTGYIPFSPPEVKSAVVQSFRKCNWDVLRRRPVPGSHPPNGKTLCDLIYELGVYFCQRTNQTGPPLGYVDAKLAEYRARRPAAQQQAPTLSFHGRGGGRGGGGRGGRGRGGRGGSGGGRGGNYRGNRYENSAGRGPRRDGGRGAGATRGARNAGGGGRR
mmetsp:Transcript_6052/g.17669  ORF Transcript_6052/g.17669 Transcript_6052/m.17669 type:complete len:327 (-) Transcript_6052:246-1226(-)